LQTLDRLASEADHEVALAESTMQRHQEWVAAGRPGVMSHDRVKALLLGRLDAAE